MSPLDTKLSVDVSEWSINAFNRFLNDHPNWSIIIAFIVILLVMLFVAYIIRKRRKDDMLTKIKQDTWKLVENLCP